MNILDKTKKVGLILASPADNTGLFPTVFRVGVYGIILTLLQYKAASLFDANELFTIVSFSSIMAIIEINWKKYSVGKILYWHLISLILLIAFLSVLLNQAMEFRSAWYRTNVLEKRIEELINTAPAAIIVADGNGYIKDSNKYVTNLIGWEKNELQNQPLTIFMRPHKALKHNEAYQKEAVKLKEGSATWINVGDRIFRMVTKNNEIIKVQIYIFGIRYSPDSEQGVYPKGQDTEFYAIIQPVKPLLDLEELNMKIEEIEMEENNDRKEEIKSLERPKI